MTEPELVALRRIWAKYHTDATEWRVASESSIPGEPEPMGDVIQTGQGAAQLSCELDAEGVGAVGSTRELEWKRTSHLTAKCQTPTLGDEKNGAEDTEFSLPTARDSWDEVVTTTADDTEVSLLKALKSRDEVVSTTAASSDIASRRPTGWQWKALHDFYTDQHGPQCATCCAYYSSLYTASSAPVGPETHGHAS